MRRVPTLLLVALACLPTTNAAAADPAPATRAQREMRIHKVDELGLEIWVEHQPPWDAELTKAKSLPAFVVQSPPDYYPPAVMTYLTVPGRVADVKALAGVAKTAIRQAAENYRVAPTVRVGLQPQPARYGVLTGYESSFEGWANGEAVEVKVFVGHVPGHAPVAMQVYTLRGKLAHLSEPVRRAWTKIKYLR